jgi:hypothetical protein
MGAPSNVPPVVTWAIGSVLIFSAGSQVGAWFSRDSGSQSAARTVAALFVRPRRKEDEEDPKGKTERTVAILGPVLTFVAAVLGAILQYLAKSDLPVGK